MRGIGLKANFKYARVVAPVYVGSALSMPTASRWANSFGWEGEQWTVPINLGVSKVMKLGGQPLSLGLQGEFYAEGPDTAPDWGVRLTLTLMFPQA